MTPRGPDDHETGDLPDPPYSAEILADLHAGALPDRTAAHIHSRIVDDVAAQSILAALDHTSDDLRSAGPAPAPVPDQVRADVATTLAALGRDPAPVDISAARRGRRPARSRSRDDRRMAGRLLLAAAAVVVGAVGTVGILRLVSAPDATNPGQTPRAQSSSVPTPAGPADVATALSVLGRTDGAPFGSVEALRRCTAAHLVPVEVVIVGSGRVLVDGTGAAAILLSTGVAGRFDALIVGLDCDLGNPALISRGIVGG
ncbi:MULTISPECIES: hypothetical protein [unclassified Gordonia (in: high G+C Gram-positive bacteria)]|uniref:hypothetical protein n=1 Tax=unclassified Gordonia (in: high G+C Gram-positive bacteria) TaxID=2657482 RepID=UPI0010F81E38|nr:MULTISPECIES: hypothetical protein [unclassified Gordonia (in: high G+C Gram-positive bacteria)]